MKFTRNKIIIAIITIIIIVLAIILPLVLVKSSSNSSPQPTVNPNSHSEVRNFNYSYTDLDYSVGSRKYLFTWEKPLSPIADKFLYRITIYSTNTPYSTDYNGKFDKSYNTYETNMYVDLEWGNYYVIIQNLANADIDTTFIPYYDPRTSLFIPAPPIPTIQSPQPTVNPNSRSEVRNFNYSYTDLDYSVGSRKYLFTWEKPLSPIADKFLYRITIYSTNTPYSTDYNGKFDKSYNTYETNMYVDLEWNNYYVLIQNLANADIDTTFIPDYGQRTILFIPAPPIPTGKS